MSFILVVLQRADWSGLERLGQSQRVGNNAGSIREPDRAEEFFDRRLPRIGITDEARVAVAPERRELHELRRAAVRSIPLEPRSRIVLAPVAVVLAVEPQHGD